MSEGKEILVKEGIDQGTVDAARALESDKYAEGFVTDIEMELAPKGLSEDTVRYISAKKEEPEWMLQWRLEAFQRWKEMIEPTWAMINYPKIDYQDAHYYAEPKGAAK
ncbi:MAG TPA: Fe-S cluster assembly protein SufB, partial [Hyphomonadaceae bacterium]|nr:Fe-S cluster assembly protein SufB [Hyphomonadaceae bacterium]